MALGSSLSILFLFFFISISYSSSSGVPRPSPWPPQFHSVLYINHSGALSMVDLWYDWTNGRNFNIIQHQLGDLLYDLEWNNGTSFYYSLPPSPPRCRTITFDVGILRPDWLDGATYLGQETIDGFQCNVWEKADFIWYYEDIATRRPVHWLFYTGRSVHVMTFEVGAVLEDAKWQAPAYCFEKKDEDITKPQSIISTGSHGNLMKGKSVRGLAGYHM